MRNTVQNKPKFNIPTRTLLNMHAGLVLIVATTVSQRKVLDAWDPSSEQQSRVGGLFEMIRPPMPGMRAIIKDMQSRLSGHSGTTAETADQRRPQLLEVGVGDANMLMAAGALFEKGPAPCMAGINNLAYYYSSHNVLHEVAKFHRKRSSGSLAAWMGLASARDF